MSVRVQVILDEEDAAQFKSHALKEAKSLSAWLRDAGREMLMRNRQYHSLTDVKSLKMFFEKCGEREKESEPDWDEHKELILNSYRAGNRQ